MGTRGLTMVIHKKEVKVAQYGQWDHYPSGQGSTIFKFLINNDIEKLKSGLERCRFIVEGSRKHKEIEKLSQEKWLEKYPQLSRDVGGRILEMVANSKENETFWLTDNRNFRDDNVFCEYTYIIDLDKNELQIYEGGYNLIKSFKFNELPGTKELFLEEIKKVNKDVE